MVIILSLPSFRFCRFSFLVPFFNLVKICCRAFKQLKLDDHAGLDDIAGLFRWQHADKGRRDAMV